MTAAFEDGDTVYLAAERATVPAAVAEAVLAVHGMGWVTGQTIFANGGYTTR